MIRLKMNIMQLLELCAIYFSVKVFFFSLTCFENVWCQYPASCIKYMNESYIYHFVLVSHNVSVIFKVSQLKIKWSSVSFTTSISIEVDPISCAFSLSFLCCYFERTWLFLPDVINLFVHSLVLSRVRNARYIFQLYLVILMSFMTYYFWLNILTR